jgi:hypothetical protein
MLWLIAAVLVVAWLVALVFEITMAAIHLLVVAAVALVVWNFLRRRTGAHRTPA